MVTVSVIDDVSAEIVDLLSNATEDFNLRLGPRATLKYNRPLFPIQARRR